MTSSFANPQKALNKPDKRPPSHEGPLLISPAGQALADSLVEVQRARRDDVTA